MQAGRHTWRSLLSSPSSVIAAYLIAIVAANVSVTVFGPAAAPVNAFLFIGLDLTLRDRLHDAWGRRGRVWKMALLILAGATLSYALAAPQVAIASAIAFALATGADALAYAALGPWARALRVNGSNAVGALVDSIAFPTIAFGVFMPAVVLAQFAAKALGGLVWFAILRRAEH